MRFLFVLALLVLHSAVVLPDATAASGRVCRKSCGAKLVADCEGLKRPALRRCRRDLIRRCKNQGQDVCSTATTTILSSTTTTSTTLAECSGRISCGTFCCDLDKPVCASNGDVWCCDATTPIYCPDRGAGRYCCQATSTCSALATEKRCVLP